MDNIISVNSGQECVNNNVNNSNNPQVRQNTENNGSDCRHGKEGAVVSKSKVPECSLEVIFSNVSDFFLLCKRDRHKVVTSDTPCKYIV